MEFFNNPYKLFGSAFLLFVLLTFFVAIVPAFTNEQNNAVLPGTIPLNEDALSGKAIYVANGCVACHTQQVRNIDMDRPWGNRPSIAADYADNRRTDFWRNTATLMGTERTGPDLTSIGQRQSSTEWNLVHLFNPRIVVSQSVMPAYPWLFEYKKNPTKKDVIVAIPATYEMVGKKLVAKKEALQLVAYLQSLRQAKLPDNKPVAEFLYQSKSNTIVANQKAPAIADGVALYTQHCQACHRENGEGLKGAFPPLKGSLIVLDDNPERMLQIIMRGYDANPQYGTMPPVGTNSQLTADEITSIMNHERNSWGNNAKTVTVEEVKALIAAVALLPDQQ